VAVTVTVGELGTAFGARYKPELTSMVPASAGDMDHVTLWFVVPVADAAYCQFAPAPIGQGALAQGSALMLTVSGGGGTVTLGCELPPPHAARESIPEKRKSREQFWRR
jgi:hypothetical protein